MPLLLFSNGVDLTGLLGDIKEDWRSGGRKSPSGVRGGAPVGGLGDKVPQKLKFFCETTHNICIKIQQTTVAVTLADILNNITSKILGGHYHGCPPFINIGGKCPPLSHRERRPCPLRHTIRVLHCCDVSKFAELKLLPLFVRHIYFRCDGDTWRCEYYCHWIGHPWKHGHSSQNFIFMCLKKTNNPLTYRIVKLF